MTAAVLLTPPPGGDVLRFDLDDDVIVHQVVTADVSVVLRSDHTGATTVGDLPASPGAIATDTVTGAVPVRSVGLTGGMAPPWPSPSTTRSPSPWARSGSRYPGARWRP